MRDTAVQVGVGAADRRLDPADQLSKCLVLF